MKSVLVRISTAVKRYLLSSKTFNWSDWLKGSEIQSTVNMGGHGGMHADMVLESS